MGNQISEEGAKVEESKIQRKLILGIVGIILVACGLCVTTFAIVNSAIHINNTFSTGAVKINLIYEKENEEGAIISGSELFEPGKTITRTIKIENAGTAAAYYRMYFKNVNGELADTVKVLIKETGNNGVVLCDGTMLSLVKDDKGQVNGAAVKTSTLAIGQTRDIEISFIFPAEVSIGAGSVLTFEIGADAVQSENNTNKEF